MTEKLARCSASKSRQLAQERGSRYSRNTRCVCVRTILRWVRDKGKSAPVSDDSVHHWLAGVSARERERERFLNETTARFYIKPAILRDAHKRESRIALQCSQSFRDHTERLAERLAVNRSLRVRNLYPFIVGGIGSPIDNF